jgi:hypothetical protein
MAELNDNDDLDALAAKVKDLQLYEIPRVMAEIELAKLRELRGLREAVEVVADTIRQQGGEVAHAIGLAGPV